MCLPINMPETLYHSVSIEIQKCSKSDVPCPYNGASKALPHSAPCFLHCANTTVSSILSVRGNTKLSIMKFTSEPLTKASNCVGNGPWLPGGRRSRAVRPGRMCIAALSTSVQTHIIDAHYRQTRLRISIHTTKNYPGDHTTVDQVSHWVLGKSD